MNIALSGKIASGKTSVGNYLVAEHGYTRMFFADPLKQLGNQFISLCRIDRQVKIDRSLRKHVPNLYYLITEMRSLLLDILKDDKLVEIAERQFLNEIFPKHYNIDFAIEKSDLHRSLLQLMGTEVIRKLKPNAWIGYLVDKVTNHDGPIVVDDVRFKSELQALKDIGFVTVRLHMSPLIQENRIKTLYGKIPDERLNHISETDLDKAEFDFSINSNEPLNIVLNEINNIVGGAV